MELFRQARIESCYVSYLHTDLLEIAFSKTRSLKATKFSHRKISYPYEFWLQLKISNLISTSFSKDGSRVLWLTQLLCAQYLSEF